MTVPASRTSAWRVAALVGAAFLGLGAGAGLILAPAPTPDILSVSDQPATVTVAAREYRDPVAMQVAPQVDVERESTSRAFGTVRDYRCVSGEPLHSGATLLLVNDFPVIALHLSSPPWRDLAQGMTGDDVADLQRELTALGFAVAVDGRYGARTGDAVEALWHSVGVAGDPRSMPLDRLVWLAAPEVTPTACPLQLGQQIAPGTVVFSAGGGLSGLKVALPEGALDGDRVATIGAVTVPVPADLVIRDAGFLAAFSAAHPADASTGDGSSTLTVQTELATPIAVVAVPPSALYDLSGGDACVLGPASPVAVRVIASQLGEVMVTAATLPTEVATRPGDHPAPCR